MMIQLKTEKTNINTEEKKRLKALHDYDILDTGYDEDFDNLTELAASICGTPISMIILIDKSRQWSKSIYGLDKAKRETKREDSICQHAIVGSDLYEVKKISESDYNSKLPANNNGSKMEYYLGAPLIDENGYALGALCVIDYKERKLSKKQKKQLKILANEVMARLELRKKNKELIKANQHKTELLKVLSHDMRSPLSGIIGVSNLLTETLTAEDDDKEMLSIIEQSASQLNQMIDEVLSYAILESDGFKINRRDTDVDAIINKMLNLYLPSARNKNITLSIANQNINKPISLDKEKFEQILGNLISNSIKFTEEGGAVSAKLKKLTQNNASYLEVHVSDSGIGMSEEKRNTLFHQDSSHSEEGTSGEKTTGLGTRIIKHFVDLHNGSVDVKSAPGKGFDFFVQIPI